MKYAIKMIDQNGNWEADSIGCAKRMLYYGKDSFLRINTISERPYFFYIKIGEFANNYASYQEAQYLCKKLRKLSGNSRSFRPISRMKCLYLTNRNYSSAELTNYNIGRLRERNKANDPVKETPFETLRRKNREKENNYANFR